MKGIEKKISLFMVVLITVLAFLNGKALASTDNGNRDWRWPVPASNSLSSCYMDGRNHYALDISAGKGSNVYASYAGTVIAVSNRCTHNYGKGSSCGCGGGLGNYVYIRSKYNGINYVHRYAHLTRVNVSVGASVNTSTILGTVGSTGYSGGYHLDFRIFKGYSAQDDKAASRIDPFKNEFLVMPNNLNANAATTGCCKQYVQEVKNIYQKRDSQKPVISSGSIIGYDSKGYMIQVNATDNVGIKEAKVATWSETLGQSADIKWKTMTNTSINEYKYYVHYSDHSNKTGLYRNHVYVRDTAGNEAFISINAYTEKSDTTPPTMKDAKIEGQDKDGYMLNVTVADNADLEKVVAISWSESQGKSRDAKEQSMVRNGNTNEWRLYVPYKDHKNATGVYHNDLIAYDKNKNKTVISIQAFAPTSSKNSSVTLKYMAHVQNLGDRPWVKEGEVAGTTGKSLRLEAYSIILKNPDGSSAIKYRSHVSNIGWKNWVTSGKTSGTMHRGLAIEAVQIKLTGQLAKEYNIYYRLHLKDKGWTEYKCNGAVCGTTGEGRRAEALEIRLEKK